MRTGFAYSIAFSTMVENWSSRFDPVAHVARVDAVLVQHLRAFRHLGEQLVPVEVEVAHERHAHAHLLEAIADLRHLARGFERVHGDAHDLRARARERGTCSAVARASSVSVLVID
jgi:hypothetical protein